MLFTLCLVFHDYFDRKQKKESKWQKRQHKNISNQFKFTGWNILWFVIISEAIYIVVKYFFFGSFYIISLLWWLKMIFELLFFY